MIEKKIIERAWCNVEMLSSTNDDNFTGSYDSDIELVEEIVNKAIPKKPKLFMYDGYGKDESVYDGWKCPYCGKRYQITFDHYDYCPKCGQRIDFGDAE